jgi:hypothetical protein
LLGGAPFCVSRHGAVDDGFIALSGSLRGFDGVWVVAQKV